MPDRVFAYGSNMQRADLQHWLTDRGFARAQIVNAGPATLRGYRLVFDYRSTSRDGGVADVEPDPENVVFGLVLEVDEDGLRALDRKEGHPKVYDRGSERVTVSLRRDSRGGP